MENLIDSLKNIIIDNWLIIYILLLIFILFIFTIIAITLYLLHILKIMSKKTIIPIPNNEKPSLIIFQYYKCFIDILEIDGYIKLYDETPMEYAKRIDNILNIDFVNITRIYLRTKTCSNPNENDIEKIESFLEKLYSKIEEKNTLWRRTINIFNFRYFISK